MRGVKRKVAEMQDDAMSRIMQNVHALQNPRPSRAKQEICRRKVGMYHQTALKKRHLLQTMCGLNLQFYLCPVCNMWHLGHRNN